MVQNVPAVFVALTAYNRGLYFRGMPLGDALLRGTRIDQRYNNQEYEKHEILQCCIYHRLHPLLCLRRYIEFIDKLEETPDILVIIRISGVYCVGLQPQLF